MRKLTLLISLCYSSFCFGQNKIEYANFIQTDTAIKWAAIYTSYINLTPVNPNFSIRNFYINKLKLQSVKTYQQDSLLFAVTPVMVSDSAYKRDIKLETYDNRKTNWYFYFSDDNNGFEQVFYHESNNCDSCLYTNDLSFFKVKQLLYYKDHQLKIQNILISPLIYKKEKDEVTEGVDFYSSKDLAFNDASSDVTTIPASAKFIARAANDISLLVENMNNDIRILTMNNWSLGWTLYKDINRNIVKAYDATFDTYPNKKNILDPRKIEHFKNPPVETSISNDSGVVVYVVRQREQNYDSFYTYTLIQDFYFDFEHEKLYSKPVALISKVRSFTNEGIDMGFVNYWGVIFPEPKKKIIKK